MRQAADRTRNTAPAGASTRISTLVSAFASALVVATGFVGLLFGLDLRLPPAAPHAALVAFMPTREAIIPPPPPSPPPPARPTRKAGGRSPAPEGHKGAPVVAPRAELVLAPPPPFATAPVAGSGGAGNAGTGTGNGGNGSGRGSGTGSGVGAAGFNAGVATFPRQIAGKMYFSDLPDDLRKARAGAELTVRYRIGVDGLVSGCTVIASSGRPELDAATCAHITSRFRFRPARDAAGRPTPFVMTETQGWNNDAQ